MTEKDLLVEILKMLKLIYKECIEGCPNTYNPKDIHCLICDYKSSCINELLEGNYEDLED